jgi:hypothetical protein
LLLLLLLLLLVLVLLRLPFSLPSCPFPLRCGPPPRFNEKTGLLEPSRIPAGPTARGAGLPNLTVMNLLLVAFGPMSERALCVLCMGLQCACGGFAFYLRYSVAHLLYDTPPLH